MNICLYGASSNRIHADYITATEQLGEALGKAGHGLVYGGGAGGLMGAAARGMTAAGGEIIGISPEFFKVDGELYENCTRFIYTKTMRERKKLLEDYADGFLIVPGGIGTFDEFFEIFALRQLDLHSKPIALFNIKGYYEPLLAMIKHAVTEGFVREECLSLIPLLNTPEEVVDYFKNYVPLEDGTFSVSRKIGLG